MTSSTRDRLAGISRSGIREIMELAARRPGTIHLEVGQPDFDTPAHIIDAAAAAARDGFTKYTSSRGLAELRSAVADKLARVNAMTADPDRQIVVTAGAANGLLVALAACVGVGQSVLIPDPGWPNYASMARMLGLAVERYPLSPSEGFQPDVDVIGRSIRDNDVGAIIVNSPGNPTGSVISEDRLRAIVEIVEASGVTLISDECYDEIVLTDDSDRVSPASLTPDAWVVSVFSLSKTYAMTGWRIGYLAGPHGDVDRIARIQETWLSCVSAPVQKAAEAALRGDQSSVGEMVTAYRRRREVALATADELGLRVSPPDGAFYLMVGLKGESGDGLSFARRLLEDHGVAVAPGETFGSNSERMVRVSLAAAEDDIATGLRRLAALLSDLG